MNAGKMINCISARLRRRSCRTGKSLGITEVQGKVLEFILVEGRERELYQKDIEKEFGLRPPTATELLKTLEEQGHISRISSEQDARYKKIKLNEHSKHLQETWQALLEQIQRTEALLTEGIAQADLDVFMKVTKRMLENLDRENEGRENCV